jgi:hypothetical protein
VTESTTPAQPTPQPYPYTAPARDTNGFAIASMVLGVLGVLGIAWDFGLGSVLAVVLGHVALVQTKRHSQSGRGLALAGVVLGYIGIGMFVLFLLTVIAARAHLVPF